MEIEFQKSGGLVPAIIQDERTGDVLMLGFMNPESLAETQRTGEAVFFSRSRNKLWKKGESSGHVLRVREIRLDCDADALLVRVEDVGPGVCHEGYRGSRLGGGNGRSRGRIVGANLLKTAAGARPVGSGGAGRFWDSRAATPGRKSQRDRGCAHHGKLSRHARRKRPRGVFLGRH